ncbi:hypothetical protein RGQ29_018905 [Quercus rubra]|uniref:Cystatin domain-containing protein n=1 Tax=Quercus rubra TaxID=3512 RepID=A0AAN7F746_QUERU|nr:hypothetical protein RGQ29_018905 [Quercus rubra]
MKTQNCFYLLTLLILSLYTTTIGGKRGVLDDNEWHPIKNIKDQPFINVLGEFSVYEYNRRSKSQLQYVKVVKAATRSDNGTYYRLILEAKDGAATELYQAIWLERPWELLRNLTSFTPISNKL